MGNYPNATNPFKFFSNFSQRPEHLKRMVDEFIDNSGFGTKVKQRFPGNNNEDGTIIRGGEMCGCFNQEFGSIDFDCPICLGSGVKTGWAEKILRVFFWFEFQTSLHRFSELQTVAGDLTRSRAKVYLHSEDIVKMGDLLVIEIPDQNPRDLKEVEYEVKEVIPRMLGSDIAWYYAIVTRQPFDKSTSIRVRR